MSDLQPSVQPLQRLRDQAIAALVPFFLDSPSSDAMAARLVIAALLDDYHPATAKELELATQIVALSWAALGCLRTAVAAKNLSIEQVLDLQVGAIELDRSCQKASRALESRRRERDENPREMTPEQTNWDEGAFQLEINQAFNKMADANAKFANYLATLAPVEPRSKLLSILSAERMTPAVLARRAARTEPASAAAD